MFLAAIFGYAIWAPSLWLKFVLVVLYVLLAVALWQKAEERLPLLLDPTRSPPRRISLADGMVYTLLFFVLQELAALLYRAAGVEALGHVVLLAYVTAGIGTVLIAASGLPPGAVARIVGHHAGRPFRGRALLAGIGAGLAAAALGLGWIFVIHHVPFLERVAAERARVSIYDGPGTFLALSALAVLAAPVVEEFLFRGIVFRGLARLVGPTLAVVGSSLLFAVVHPAISFPAVFGLGVAAALIYRRTRSLPASMATHMVYNAVVMVAAAAL
jgi:hypothetical protein